MKVILFGSTGMVGKSVLRGLRYGNIIVHWVEPPPTAPKSAHQDGLCGEHRSQSTAFDGLSMRGVVPLRYLSTERALAKQTPTCLIKLDAFAPSGVSKQG